MALTNSLFHKTAQDAEEVHALTHSLRNNKNNGIQSDLLRRLKEKRDQLSSAVSHQTGNSKFDHINSILNNTDKNPAEVTPHQQAIKKRKAPEGKGKGAMNATSSKTPKRNNKSNNGNNIQDLKKQIQELEQLLDFKTTYIGQLEGVSENWIICH